MSADPLRNPKDPLHKSGPEAQRELIRRMCQQATGFQRDDVLSAAMNVIINVLRQEHGNRAKAEAAFDEIVGRSKTVLLDHYDANGNRRNVFPFHQVIQMPLINLRARQ